jgi:GTP-binding protein
LTELDQAMLDWFAPTNKPVHILLTKADKYSRQQATQTLMKVRSYLTEFFPHCSVQLFSSLKKQGMEEAEAVIGGWFAAEEHIDAGVEDAPEE